MTFCAPSDIKKGDVLIYLHAWWCAGAEIDSLTNTFEDKSHVVEAVDTNDGRVHLTHRAYVHYQKGEDERHDE